MLPVIFETGIAALNGVFSTAGAAINGVVSTLWTGSFGG